jgi:hypothetical protein
MISTPFASLMRLGAAASVVQSALFVVIGATALLLGVDRLTAHGFASFLSTDPTAFRVLCGALVAIATLGVAITPAERALIASANPGLATFGASLAHLGHAGTIAFFSWWLLKTIADDGGAGLDAIAPIEFGMMFELVFVGAWVWIIAAVARGEPSWPRGFLFLSVAKATSFWFTFLAFLTMEKWMLLLGLGAVTFATGPSWHLWIARIMLRRVDGASDAG